MQLETVPPNPVMLICVLKACGNVGALDKVVKIHAQMLKHGMMGSESAAGNVLVDMYCKCGFLKKARELFDHLVTRDVVSWNALMFGYADHNHASEVLSFFGANATCWGLSRCCLIYLHFESLWNPWGHTEGN
ncbi:hypothetical protein GOP47_0002167 [Adiantum capillus-veneris]|uniref:Pentatricopeptide repeat-containing protein n=1 Tax=Adiantum capillus-veneris TaxID=13818 RepID=A0A9D4V9V0_ADICA|nr:hypothetical protein GOP47_0002167 [Adiantum capillus-veneris]